jgi:hypothetical protein
LIVDQSARHVGVSGVAASEIVVECGLGRGAGRIGICVVAVIIVPMLSELSAFEIPIFNGLLE